MLTINDTQYDFLDFGASKGGSIDFGMRGLGGKRGLGIDISPDKVSLMRAKGYDCIEGDITNLKHIPDNAIRFVIISHVLEHLESLEQIAAAVSEAIRVASDFVFIQGPYYDADDYLAEHNLRFYWSHWTDHSYHLKVTELANVLAQLETHDEEILLRHLVTSSSDDAIHSLASAVDQHAFDAAIHPEKPRLQFDQPVYREFVCYVAKRPLPNWQDIIRSRSLCYYKQNHGAMDYSNVLFRMRRFMRKLRQRRR